MTDAELRAFGFFHLKRRTPLRPLPTGTPWFNGIVAAQPFLMSVLEVAPRIFAHLAATYFFRAWPSSAQAAEEERAQRLLVGLLRAAKDGLAILRADQRTNKQNERARRAPLAAPCDPAQRDAVSPGDDRDRRLDRVERELAKLPEVDRRIVEGRRRGEKWKEIAGAVGLPRYQYAQKRYERILRELKKRLRQ